MIYTKRIIVLCKRYHLLEIITFCVSESMFTKTIKKNNLDYSGIKSKKMAQFGLNCSHFYVCELDRTILKSFITVHR